MNIAVVGAGLTGAAIARLLADNGHQVFVFEKDKIGGMCADDFDQKGYIQHYGPHIFHTNNDEVISFLSKFAYFDHFDHKVIADTERGFMPWPINIRSIKKSFGVLSKRKALKLLEEDKNDAKQSYEFGWLEDNFRTKAILLAGYTLYKNFIENYTQRQWGRWPSDLPSELINRVEIREDKYDKFFKDKYVLMPVTGYSDMIRRMLYHINIDITYEEVKGTEMLREFDFVFNTAFCSDLLSCEELETIRIKFEKFDDGRYDKYFNKKYAVVNNCRPGGDYTRVTNMNRFFDLPFGKRLIAEIPSEDGYKLYPVRTKKNLEIQDMMDKQLKEIFDGKIINCGRCGGYKYINMDQAVELAFKVVAEANL